MGEEPLLPTRQEDDIEFETLGAVQRHDGKLVARSAFGILHHQRNVIEEAFETVEILERVHKFLQILEPARRLDRLVLLPHRGVAAFIKHDLRKLGVMGRLGHLPPAGKVVHEGAERPPCRWLEFVRRDDLPGDFRNGQRLRAGDLVELFQGRIADAAAWRVDDALEGKPVFRLMDEAQVCQRIADFLALVEARAADDAIGNAQRDEAFLELAGLEAGTHQDRHVLELGALALQAFHFLADLARFLRPVPRAEDADLFALGHIGPQRLAQAAFIVRDETRGGGEDVRGGAVILLQADHLGAGKILLELQYVLDLGPAPAIDGLIIVAHTADVLVGLGERAQPEILCDVGVLVFVDQDIAELFLVALQPVRRALEDGEIMQEQIAEIAGIERQQALLVGVIKIEDAARGKLGKLRPAHLVGCKTPVLPAFDEPQHHARRPAL